MGTLPPENAYRFPPFRLDPGAYRLVRDEAPVSLAPKALDLLLLLVSRPGALVSKDEIMRVLWTDVAVTDNALTQVVSDLRQALGDDPSSPRFIQTVPRRGYRFIAAIETQAAPDRPSLTGAVTTSPPPGSVPRAGARETSSVEAYRLFTEGRLKLERMDPAQVPDAIRDFERAIALDPRYAPPYVGLAHARFWIFEASRARNRPDEAGLTAAIADAHRAIDLDPDLSEAHAALALMLSAKGRTAEALAAGRRAVALEPGSWRNYCRLAVPAWGDERIAALERVLALYPRFAPAYYGIATVHIARNDLDAAAQVLRQGVPFQDRAEGVGERFPGKGLHWLLGLTRLACGDANEARVEFDRELASVGNDLYAAEFRMNAYDGHGFAHLRDGDLQAARDMFTRALETFPDHARSLLGFAAACREQELATRRNAALDRAAAVIAELRTNGRTAEALIGTAFRHMVCQRPSEAIAALAQLLEPPLPGFAAWTLPIEPFFEPLRIDPAFRTILSRLADRAR